MSSYHLLVSDDPYRVFDAAHLHAAGSVGLNVHLSVDGAYSQHVAGGIQLTSPQFLAPNFTSHEIATGGITLELPLSLVESA